MVSKTTIEPLGFASLFQASCPIRASETPWKRVGRGCSSNFDESSGQVLACAGAPRRGLSRMCESAPHEWRVSSLFYGQFEGPGIAKCMHLFLKNQKQNRTENN